MAIQIQIHISDRYREAKILPPEFWGVPVSVYAHKRSGVWDIRISWSSGGLHEGVGSIKSAEALKSALEVAIEIQKEWECTLATKLEVKDA